jgi:hypothetical protein
VATRRRPPAPASKPHHRPQRARYLPSVTAPADQTITPGVGELTIAGYAPRVQIFDVDPVEDLSHELVFVHQVELPGYTYYHPTIPELEGVPITVPPVTFTISSAPLAGKKALIVEPGRVTYEAFPSGRTPGVVAPTYGDVEYINDSDRTLESLLLGVPTDGAKLTCYRGHTRAVFPDDFEVDYIAYINGTPKFTSDRGDSAGRITVGLRDRSGLLNALVCEQTFDYALSDATEGRRRRIVYGEAGYPGAILYIPFEVLDGNVWYLQLNEPNDLDAIYDGGVQLINQGEASSLQDLFTGTVPNPSSYRWFYDDGTSDAENRGTWIRLGSKVRVDLRYRANSGSATISDLAVAAGIDGAATMEADSVDLDVGARVIEEQTYRDVMEDVAKANLSIIGFSRLDEFFQRYLVPSHSTDYDTTFTFTDGVNSHEWQVYPLNGLERRIRELQVNAGATTKGQLAGIPDLDGSAAEALSRDAWLTKFTTVNAGLAADDPSADSITFDIQQNAFAGDQAGMLAYAAEVYALFGGIQVFTWLTAQYTPETAALQLMDRVTLAGDRMTAGKKARIISIERQLGAERIAFGLWTHYSTIPESAVEITALDDATTATAGSATSRGSKDVRQPEAAVIPCMGDDDPIETVGIVRSWPDFPYPMRLATISAAVNTPQGSGSAITVDVFVDDVSVFSVPITIDNGDTKSTDATTQPVLTTKEIMQGQKVKIQVTNYGDGTATGLVVTFTGIQ